MGVHIHLHNTTAQHTTMGQPWICIARDYPGRLHVDKPHSMRAWQGKHKSCPCIADDCMRAATVTMAGNSTLARASNLYTKHACAPHMMCTVLTTKRCPWCS